MKRVKGLHFFLLVLICTGRVWAAPVDLEAPSNSLGASDLYGNVRIWREIEDVDFGKGLVLPLRLGFSSADQRSSPYVGRGWTVTVLESQAFLKREKLMKVILLCGKSLYLRRDAQDMNKFQTLDKEWTGMMKGDQITISRPDGWELRYRQGKIRQMRTDTGRVLNWVYNGDIVSSIQEEGSAKPSPLQVMMSGGGKTPVGMVVNGKLHQFGMEKRPLVRAEDGKNVVAQLDPSLASWNWPDGKKETFEFGVTSEIAPTLKLTDQDGQVVDYIWEPSGHIRSAEGWNYKIGEVNNPLDLPRITRSNSKGEEEYTETDMKTGITDRQTLEEGHRITQVFVSPGPLYDKVRKVEEVGANGEKKTVLQLSYDEKGRLFREIDQTGFATVFNYGNDGRLAGKTVFPPTDSKIIEQLKAKEEVLMMAVENASTELTKQEKLQNLALFYLYKLHRKDKALTIISMLTERKLLFQLKVAIIADDQQPSYHEKIKDYQKLLKEFPEKQQYLNWMIGNAKEMIAEIAANKAG